MSAQVSAGTPVSDTAKKSVAEREIEVVGGLMTVSTPRECKQCVRAHERIFLERSRKP